MRRPAAFLSSSPILHPGERHGLRNLPGLDSLPFESLGEDLLIFDSSDSPDGLVRAITQPLKRGRYHVSTASVEPNERTSLLLHVFEAVH